MNIKTVTHHGLTRFQVDYYQAGERKRRFFEKEVDAEAFVRTEKERLAKFGLAGASLPARELAHIKDNLATIAEHGATLDQVVKYFMDHAQPKATRTVGEAVTEYLAIKEQAGGRRSSINTRKCTLSSLRESLGVDLPLVDVTTAGIESWLNGNGWAPRTRQGYLVDCRSLFRWCVKRAYLAKDPTTSIESIIVSPEPPGILTVDQCASLMSSTRKVEPTLVPYVTLALFCGIRPQEVKRLSWPAVDMKARYVHIGAEASKTRQRRLVTIADNAMSWLALGGDVPPVDMSNKLLRVRQDCGLLKAWPHDCLRHSFCSYHYAKHKNAALVASEAGHSEDVMFNHYRELVKPDEAELFWKILPN